VKPTDVPSEWTERVLGGPLSRDYSSFELLLRPEVSYDALLELIGPPDWPMLMTVFLPRFARRSKYAPSTRAT